MMPLKDLLDRYAALAATSGEPVALAAFGFSSEQTSALFSALDEDYHISRFLFFSKAAGTPYQISGNPATHVRLDPAIRTLL